MSHHLSLVALWGALLAAIAFLTAVPTASTAEAATNIFSVYVGTYTNSNSNYTYSPRQLQLAGRLHF